MTLRQRASWPETWMSIARLLAEKRSHDDRLQVCALVIPEDNTGILALGYNGRERGGPNEPASNEPGQSLCIHAEENCLIKCPYHYPVKKLMYVTHSPCANCARLIINANIAGVIYGEVYRDISGIEILRAAGISVLHIYDV